MLCMSCGNSVPPTQSGYCTTCAANVRASKKLETRGLRRCEFTKFILPVKIKDPKSKAKIPAMITKPGTCCWGKPEEGFFHAWGVNHEELEGGPGNFTVGIVEDIKGNVYVIHDPTKIKFI